MKVQSTSSNVTLNGLTNGSRAERRTMSSGESPQNSAASVDLSPAARSLMALSDDSADIRADKVQQIRDALASGELTIKPERIADGLLDSVRELLK